MCDFKPGDEIVCVKAAGDLVEGKTYICLGIYNRPCDQIDIISGDLLLAGIWVQVKSDDYGGWYPWRFRKPIIDEESIDLRKSIDA